VDESDRLLICQLVGQDVRVGGHIAVIAQEVAAVGDVPDHVAGPAELERGDSLVLDIVERTFEEQRADVGHLVTPPAATDLAGEQNRPDACARWPYARAQDIMQSTGQPRTL